MSRHVRFMPARISCARVMLRLRSLFFPLHASAPALVHISTSVVKYRGKYVALDLFAVEAAG